MGRPGSVSSFLQIRSRAPVSYWPEVQTVGSVQTRSLVRVAWAVSTWAALHTRESGTHTPLMLVYSAPTMQGEAGVAEAVAASVENCPATSVDCAVSVERAAAWLDSAVDLHARGRAC